MNRTKVEWCERVKTLSTEFDTKLVDVKDPIDEDGLDDKHNGVKQRNYKALKVTVDA